MEWILVVLIYSGGLGSIGSVTLQPIYGWQSKADCESAGNQLAPIVKGTHKDISFVCIEKKKLVNGDSDRLIERDKGMEKRPQ